MILETQASYEAQPLGKKTIALEIQFLTNSINKEL